MPPTLTPLALEHTRRRLVAKRAQELEHLRQLEANGLTSATCPVCRICPVLP